MFNKPILSTDLKHPGVLRRDLNTLGHENKYLSDRVTVLEKQLKLLLVHLSLEFEYVEPTYGTYKIVKLVK